MNGRPGPGPLSPVSMNGSEWSGISKYQNDDASPYSPISSNRGQLASPPASSSSSTMNGFPQRGGDGGPNTGGNPSPPASIARSSNGMNLYGQRDSTMSTTTNEQFEGILSEHYTSLKRFLSASLRDEKGNPRPNRARDKLLRLSPVQFQELSTDVFDELQRRQAAGRKGPNGPPPDVPSYLLPKQAFHPKRNQARQKLSTLPPPRFRDLATDVFYELERRFPRFAGGDISRIGSPASVRGPPSRSGTGTPVNGMRPGSRGAPGPGMRRPSNASSIAPYPRSDSRNGPRPAPNGIPPSPGLPPNDYNRPQAKTFQSNTIVPNKSTMVEDDESGAEEHDEDDTDAFGLEGAANSRASKRSASDGGSETDKKLIEDYQTQVTELREKLDAMEDRLRQKDEELASALDAERNQSSAADLEKKQWDDARLDLEDKLEGAQNLNESLQSELDRLKNDQSNMERELRSQIEELQVSNAGKGSRGGNDELERENQELRAELQEQQQITEEVRREAQEFLREMKMLSEQSGSSWERESQLQAHITRLEEEIKDWRDRYAKAKSQLRNLKATSIGLSPQHDAAKATRDLAFCAADGVVKDVHVTKFQMSIDELLRTARSDDPTRVVESIKIVAVNVRRITQDLEETSAGPELSQDRSKLKTRVQATANNLITASRNFASAGGVSPVSLLDAAASHLVAAVVELVRVVKIRPTPDGELSEDDDASLPSISAPGGFFPVKEEKGDMEPPRGVFANGRPRGLSNNSSMYSPINSPRASVKDSVYSRPSTYRDPGLTVGLNGKLPPTPIGAFGVRTQESDVEELKIYLEDQTAVLVSNIQSLVSSIRSDSGITAITTQIGAIASVVGNVVTSTSTAMSSTANGELRVQAEPIVKKLSTCRQRIIDAGDRGRSIADAEDEDDTEWRQWTQSLPPIAFEIARETKELVQRVDVIDADQAGRNDDEGFA